MNEFQSLLASFDYTVPPDCIATAPVHPRDSARLMVYNRKSDSVVHTTFAGIGVHLPHGAVLVCNDTKVIPARLSAVNPAGRTVEVFVTQFSPHGRDAYILSNRHIEPSDLLKFPNGAEARVQEKNGKETRVELSAAHEWRSLLEEVGTTPIPPYLKHTPLTEAELRTEYQTVFARTEGSVAAPTASLHFTNELLASLEQHGVRIVYVTLHVNLGTFAPLSEESVATGALHREIFNIPDETQHVLREAKERGMPIIPIGTTALRTLESGFDAQGICHTPHGGTQLFIQEGYVFKMASGLITNFHVPQSSLMMLVSALTGREKLLELYKKAIAERYRFFSFGDGMLIL